LPWWRQRGEAFAQILTTMPGGAVVITVYGLVAVSFMMTMYALERRHPLFTLAFAAGCLASAGYGFLAGTWPFGMVETVWAGVAARRYLNTRADGGAPRSPRGEQETSLPDRGEHD
jgi:hypothetical protein